MKREAHDRLGQLYHSAYRHGHVNLPCDTRLATFKDNVPVKIAIGRGLEVLGLDAVPIWWNAQKPPYASLDMVGLSYSDRNNTSPSGQNPNKYTGGGLRA